MPLFDRPISRLSIDPTLLGGGVAGAAGAAPAASAASLSAALVASPPVVAANPGTVFVELGEAAQKANITRDGVGVPQLTLDPAALSQFLAGKPQLVNKVVSQSVPPGTAVPKGTAIDIVLAEPFHLPIGILRDPHQGLAGRTIGDVYGTFLQNNPALRGVIARNDTAATLSEADRGVIQAAFQQANVAVNDQQPGQTTQDAFATLQAASAFAGS